MKSRIIRHGFFLMIVLAETIACAANTPFNDWDPVTEADWAVGSDSASKNYDAVIIFEKIVADEMELENEECFRTIYHRIRILNTNGGTHADIEPPYFSLEQKLDVIKGRTILRDGTIIDLSPTQIFEKVVVKTKGAKFKQKSFSLPGVTQDCIVEYVLHYRLNDNIYDWVVQKEIPLLRGELLWKFGRFTVPDIFEDLVTEYVTPNYLWLNFASKPKITHLPNIKKTTELFFEIDSIPAFDAEPFTSSENSLKCRLVCYYGTNEPASAYWGKRATEKVEELNDYSKKNKELKKVVEQFKVIDSGQAKIEAAYKWVQDSIANTSYLDEVEDDKGQKREKKKIKENNSADDVIKRRYGSREDINWVFCDMLREMNIDAKLAFVQNRSDDLLVQKAKYWQFDYSLVAVVEADGYYSFYAPGFVKCVVGQIPWFCEGVTSLMAGADEYFVPVQFSYSTNNVSRINYSLNLTDDFRVEGKSHASYSGQRARTMRLELVDEAEADHNHLLMKLFEENQPKAERDSVNFANYDDQYRDFEFSCNVKFPELSSSSDRLVLNPFDYMADAENPFHETNRKMPVLFDYAYILNEDLEMALPPGWKVEALPGNDFIDNRVGSCEVYFSLTDSVITVKRIFNLFGPFWGLENFVLVKELFSKQQSFSNLSIILTKK